MYDNKIRLSPDVLEKAQLIAQEWGLKNARAAVEAVFRRYSDEYLKGNPGSTVNVTGTYFRTSGNLPVNPTLGCSESRSGCEALDALDDLLGL